METLERYEAGDRIPMSWSDFEALGEDPRCEYINGMTVVSDAPTRRHQEIGFNLANRLKMVARPGVRVTIAWGWKPADDLFIPDVVVHDDTDEQTRYTAIPHLVVEILSADHAADVLRKFLKYADSGVPRYWIIDPDKPELTVFERDAGGDFVERGQYGPSDEAALDFGGGTLVLRPAELID